MRTTLYHGGISGAKIFIKHVNISLTEFLFVKMVFAIFPYTHIYLSISSVFDFIFIISHYKSNLKRGKKLKVWTHLFPDDFYNNLRRFDEFFREIVVVVPVIWCDLRNTRKSGFKIFFLQMFTNEEIFFPFLFCVKYYVSTPKFYLFIFHIIIEIRNLQTTKI